MGAGGMRRPGAGMSAAQNPMQKQGGAMSPSTLSQLPPGIQQAIAARQIGNPMQGGPMGGPMGGPAGMPQQTYFTPQMPPQGVAGGKGGMPGAQNPVQQNPMQQIGAGGPMNPAMYKQSFMQQQQGGPMQQMPPQGAAGGKGGMPGAGPAPNAMQQFSQQQNMAGLMQPQQSSTNSLQ